MIDPPDSDKLSYYGPSEVSTIWSYDKFNFNGFNYNGRTFIVKSKYIFVSIGAASLCQWVVASGDELPDDIREGCRLWSSNNFDMALHAYLSKMFNE